MNAIQRRRDTRAKQARRELQLAAQEIQRLQCELECVHPRLERLEDYSRKATKTRDTALSQLRPLRAEAEELRLELRSLKQEYGSAKFEFIASREQRSQLQARVEELERKGRDYDQVAKERDKLRRRIAGKEAAAAIAPLNRKAATLGGGSE